MTTGQLIKAARQKAGMTQAELAEKLGISYVGVSQWENDLRNPKRETLRRIAEALGTTVNRLLPPDNYWEDENGVGHTGFTYEQQCAIHEANSRNRLEAAYARLDLIGHQKVADYAEKLAKDPKRIVDPESPYHYRRQEAGEATPPAQEGKDTAPAEKPAEGPENGE